MRSISIFAAAAAIAAMLFGCATFRGESNVKDRQLNVNPMLPAAQGTVRFVRTQNQNTDIMLVVRHLAEPAKLTPPASVYVVWVRGSQDAPPQNIGALTVNRDLTGELRTTTPLNTFELFITAEGTGQVQQPSGPQLLWTSYNR